MADALSDCQRCGACCTTFRITLPRADLDTAPDGWIPAGLTEPYTPSSACMREHPEQPGRCIALEGEPGIEVRCSIYPQRPAACRDFAPLATLGMGDSSCDEARRRHGLPPLGRL